MAPERLTRRTGDVGAPADLDDGETALRDEQPDAALTDAEESRGGRHGQ